MLTDEVSESGQGSPWQGHAMGHECLAWVGGSDPPTYQSSYIVMVRARAGSCCDGAAPLGLHTASGSGIVMIAKAGEPNIVEGMRRSHFERRNGDKGSTPHGTMSCGRDRVVEDRPGMKVAFKTKICLAQGGVVLEVTLEDSCNSRHDTHIGMSPQSNSYCG